MGAIPPTFATGGGPPFTPLSLKETVTGESPSLRFTLPAFSSIDTTSSVPSRSPSVIIFDSGVAGAPAFGALIIVMKQRFLPNIVVIPVRVMLTGGLGASGGGAGGGIGFKPNTFRSTI